MEKNKEVIFTGQPWLVDEAVLFLDAIINPRSFVLETGAGNSTIWLAKKAAKVISFEHSKRWFNHLQLYLKNHEFKHKVDLRFDPTYPEKGIPGLGYLFDFILIDGRGRAKSVKTSLPMLKPGGFICLDNSERPRYKPILNYLDRMEGQKVIFKGKWETTFFRKPFKE